ncbi:helix-turn-helix transcriptional regulator [Falsiroseomonas sp. HW251]|uniref:helix-turn-helix transcriptional regulator n=1 Tax=Falsiroseomonas sp. HW251 TaxID=3390998 RepID=UPI003D3120FD
MSSDVLGPDPARLMAFNVVSASDPAGFEDRLRVSERFPDASRSYKYRLLDSRLWRTRFANPILSLAIRSTGAILACHGGSRFATEVLHAGDDSNFVGFTTVLQGEMTLVERGVRTTATAERGLAFRPRDQTRILTSDESVRTNVFIRVSELEGALEHMLDARLRSPLDFGSDFDWTLGLAASLKWQLAFLMNEFERPDGVASNAVALASMTDFIVALALRAAPHNYSGEIGKGSSAAVPFYVRRAEEFMVAHCADALRIADVAAAAGCSVRTLGDVFRRFRDRTPLAALHATRLDRVHAELSFGATDGDAAAIREIARLYGFTNWSRFVVAYRRRFGETPLAVARRALRA